MSSISSLGVGSGIDVRGLVDQLVAAERQPVESRLNRKEARLEAELSAFGTLKSALSGFSDAVQGLSDADSFRNASASSSSEAIEVAGSDSVDQAAAFGIQVDALAQAQSLASGSFASPSAELGSGSLTFRFGTVATDEAGAITGFTQNPARATATIQIPEGSSTLSDVRDAVNFGDQRRRRRAAGIQRHGYRCRQRLCRRCGR